MFRDTNSSDSTNRGWVPESGVARRRYIGLDCQNPLAWMRQIDVILLNAAPDFTDARRTSRWHEKASIAFLRNGTAREAAAALNVRLAKSQPSASRPEVFRQALGGATDRATSKGDPRR